MNFSYEKLKDSIAGMLNKQYEYPVYGDPIQQGANVPCFFIFFFNPKIKPQMGRFSMLDAGVDIIFLQQKNIVNAYSKAEEVAGYLDEKMELIAYSDGELEGKIRTFEREWKIEGNELHYQFRIKQRVSIETVQEDMKRMELTVEVI